MVSFFFIRLSEDCGDLIGAIDPELLVLIEERIRFRDRRAVRMHDLLPPASLFGDECRSLENSHVLLHRGKAHVVPASQRGHRLLAFDGTFEDVSTRPIGKRLEDAVDVGVRQGPIYNHRVVD